MSSIDKQIRVWLYLSDRLLETQEQALILKDLKLFTQQWAAHGRSLDASAQILWDGLFVLAVNEGVEPASGCSIDSSVAFMRSLGERYQFNPFNRNIFAYLRNEVIHYASIDNPVVAKDYQVINLNVSNMHEYKGKLLLPFEQSAYANLAIDTSFKFSL